MNFQQFLTILRGRRRVVLCIFGSVVLSILVLSLILPKKYTAMASVVIDAKTDPVAGVMYPAQMLASDTATQVDIIASARVARRVVKALRLDQDPEYIKAWRDDTGGRGDLVAWIGENSLDKRLQVTPSRESNVINIAVKWPDAKFAATLANAFAQAYIDTNIELRVDPAKQYADWFNERSRALRADLEAKQKILSDYQRQTGIIAQTDARLDIENARLQELSSQLVAIQGLRGDTQSRQRLAGKDVQFLPEVLASPVVASLKSDLSKAEANLGTIATSLGKNHPDYQTAEAEVVSLRDRIARESSKIAMSLTSANQVNLGRESDVRQALDEQRKRVLEIQGQHDQEQMLQNDVATAQRNLDAVTQRLAQSSLESQTNQTNISLLTPAVEPVESSSPRIFFNFVISCFLGAILGISAALLLEYKDRKVRGGDEELHDLLGVPILVRVGSAKGAMRGSRASAPSLGPVEPVI